MLGELLAHLLQVGTAGARANLETILENLGRALSKLHVEMSMPVDVPFEQRVQLIRVASET